MQAAVACGWIDEATGVGIQATSSELVRGLAMIAVGSSGQEGWSKRGLGHVAVWLAFVPCHCGESTLTRRPYGSHACAYRGVDLPRTYLYYSTVHGPTLLPLSLTLLAARCTLHAA
jgi:hypothetical protein